MQLYNSLHSLALPLKVLIFIASPFYISLSLSFSLRSAADDYDSVDVLITFDDMSPLGTSHCVDITITSDNITEPEETFSVTLIPVSDFVTFGIESTSLDIHDDDGKSIHILLLDQTFRQFMLIP